VLQNPYPLYRQMRDEARLSRSRFMGWILTRYDDVLAVLRDRRVSSQRPLASERVGRSLADVATAAVKSLLASGPQTGVLAWIQVNRRSCFRSGNHSGT